MSLLTKGVKSIWENEDFRPFISLIVLFAVSAAINPDFLSSYSIRSLLASMSPLMFLTLGEMLVLTIGSVDISLASALALANVLTAGLMVKHNIPVLPAILIVLAVGALVGFINGIITVKGKIPSFIVTIATGVALRGVCLVYTRGYSIPGLPTEFLNSFGGNTFGVPNAFLLALTCIILMTVIMKATKLGRYMYAMGGNEEAARAVGINADLIRILTFTIAGVFYALGGIIITAQFNSGWPQIASGWELDGIAAAVIGGANLAGGAGLPLGALAGTLILGVIVRFLVMIGLNPYYQIVAKGVIVVLASVTLSKGLKYAK